MLWVMEPLSHQPHLKSEIQSRNSDFDLVSDEEGQEDTLAHQVLEIMHLGLPSQAKRLPTLAKSPLQAVLQVAQSQRGFTLCLRNWIITALAYNRGFKTTPWIQEWVPSGAFKKQKRGRPNSICQFDTAVLMSNSHNPLPTSSLHVQGTFWRAPQSELRHDYLEETHYLLLGS
jgi:hypothetical protein